MKNLNAIKFKHEFPRATSAILEYHYVDDWLDSFSTEEETVKVAKEVRAIHQSGEFHWVSNSKRVLMELGCIE